MYSSDIQSIERRIGRLQKWTIRILIVVGCIAAILVVARLAAPSYVRRAINQRLDRIPGYSGHVGDIRLQVWRGAYRIEDMRIVQRSGKTEEPFFSAARIDFSIAWREILHGRLVSDIRITNGSLVFQRGPSEETSQLTADSRWQDVIKDIFPIDITHLEIDGGILKFIDTTHVPKVDIAVRDLKVIATGLRNRPADNGDPYPAKIQISGTTLGHGNLRLFTELEPLADKPKFKLNLELRKVSLPALNDFLKAYADVEVSQGQFELVAQMAMRDDRYEGYVKPFFDHLGFKDPDKKQPLGRRIWEEIVGALAGLAKNRDNHLIATRIPFSGDATKLDIHTWRTIANGLHHGFIEALSKGFEGTTHPDDPTSKLPGPDPAMEKKAPAAADPASRPR